MTDTLSTTAKVVLKPWVPPATSPTALPVGLTAPTPLKPWKPPQPAAVAPTAAPGAAPAPAQKTQAPETVPITGEHVFQRLRYFENLTRDLFAYVKVLTAQIVRTGTAPATLPDFPKLKSPAGDFDPVKQ